MCLPKALRRWIWNKNQDMQMSDKEKVCYGLQKHRFAGSEKWLWRSCHGSGKHFSRQWKTLLTVVKNTSHCSHTVSGRVLCCQWRGFPWCPESASGYTLYIIYVRSSCYLIFITREVTVSTSPESANVCGWRRSILCYKTWKSSVLCLLCAQTIVTLHRQKEKDRTKI